MAIFNCYVSSPEGMYCITYILSVLPTVQASGRQFGQLSHGDLKKNESLDRSRAHGSDHVLSVPVMGWG